MTERPPLTPRQEQILGFITTYQQARGYPPSFREIAAEFGIRSTNAINDHVVALTRKGYLERAGGRSGHRGAARAMRPRTPAHDLVREVKTLAHALGVDFGEGALPADWLARCLEVLRPEAAA